MITAVTDLFSVVVLMLSFFLSSHNVLHLLYQAFISIALFVAAIGLLKAYNWSRWWLIAVSLLMLVVSGYSDLSWSASLSQDLFGSAQNWYLFYGASLVINLVGYITLAWILFRDAVNDYFH